MLSSIARLLNISEHQVMHHPDLLINAFDAEHRILFWNKNCEKYFGITSHQALGQILEYLIPNTRNHPNMKCLEKAFAGKTVLVADEKYDRKNGRYSQILLPLKDNDDHVVAVINLVRTLRSSNTNLRNDQFFDAFKPSE
jgi:PAS domain S-box-containing protein